MFIACLIRVYKSGERISSYKAIPNQVDVQKHQSDDLHWDRQLILDVPPDRNSFLSVLVSSPELQPVVWNILLHQVPQFSQKCLVGSKVTDMWHYKIVASLLGIQGRNCEIISQGSHTTGNVEIFQG